MAPIRSQNSAGERRLRKHNGMKVCLQHVAAWHRDEGTGTPAPMARLRCRD